MCCVASFRSCSIKRSEFDSRVGAAHLRLLLFRPRDDMQQRQGCLMFMRQRYGIGSSGFRFDAKIGCKQNVIELGSILSRMYGLGPHRENRTRGLTKYLLGDGTHEQFLSARSAMSAHHKEIDVVFDHNVAELFPYLADYAQGSVRHRFQLPFKTGHCLMLRLLLVLHMARPDFGRNEEIVIGSKNVHAV